MRRLPPLNALRAFEAAARHLSFTKAAEELNVTPGAISQQVKALEEFVGAPVFRRHKRALLLTDEAQASLPILREAFDKLAEAAGALAHADRGGRLTVSVAPSFAAKWLVPRIDEFHAERPELEVWISADMDVVDFSKDDVDLAIRYGGGNYPHLRVERLLSEKVIPVCSPALLIGDNPLKTPQDLTHHTLLHDGSPDNDESCPTWPMWLKAAGVEGVDASRGPRFNQSSLVIEAAVAGKGVALAKSQLAVADLEAARLAIPFDMSVPIHFAYFMVCPEAKAKQPHVTAFMEWLRRSAAGTAGAAA